MIPLGIHHAQRAAERIEARPIETHVCDFGRGPNLVTAGCAVMAADMTDEETGQRSPTITILAAHAPSALCIAVDPAIARAIGEELIAIADAIEGEAADQAAAALRKAGGK